jgi:hypothetical protein
MLSEPRFLYDTGLLRDYYGNSRVGQAILITFCCFALVAVHYTEADFVFALAKGLARYGAGFHSD